MITIRNYLFDFRMKQKMTLEKMSIVIGISRNYYDSIEKGVKGDRLSLITAHKIALVMMISLDKLILLEQHYQEVKTNDQRTSTRTHH